MVSMFGEDSEGGKLSDAVVLFKLGGLRVSSADREGLEMSDTVVFLAVTVVLVG